MAPIAPIEPAWLTVAIPIKIEPKTAKISARGGIIITITRNQNLKLNSPIDAKKNKIGMVFQHFNLFETLSVFENLSIDATEDNKSLRVRINEIFKKYNLLKKYKMNSEKVKLNSVTVKFSKSEIISCINAFGIMNFLINRLLEDKEGNMNWKKLEEDFNKILNIINEKEREVNIDKKETYNAETQCAECED